MRESNLLIEGENIYLIPIEEQYLDEYYEKLSNSSLESIRNTGSTSLEITKDGLKNYLGRICKDNQRADFFIVNKSNDEIVGEVVINEVDQDNKSANTRIAIFHEKDFNKNYGKQAMKLALKYGFDKFNLHRVGLQVYAFNKRAIHVYEQLGFKLEGILRDYLYFENQYHDALVMSILENEFKG